MARANGYASVLALFVLKVMLRVSGRAFKLSCSLTLLRQHILVILRSNFVANEDYTIIGNRSGFLSVLSFAWFYFSSGSPVSAKHSKKGECSCSHGLLAFISHTRLSKELFVFLPLLSSGANLALRQLVNKDTTDRGKVFVCVIRVVYRTPGFSVSNRMSKNEASSYFLVWPPSICQLCGLLYSKRLL